MRVAALFVLGFVSSLPAQFIVSGGGTNLANAVANAPDGAVLLVSPGNYDGFTIAGKGLTILGGAGVLITSPIDISNTAPHQPFTLREITWANADMPVLLAIDNCHGAVHLDRIVQPPNLQCLHSTPNVCYRPWGIESDGCKRLFLRDCILRSGVAATYGDTVIDSCVIEGLDALPSHAFALAGVALAVGWGTTQVSGPSVMHGGDGWPMGTWNSLGRSGIALHGDLRLLDGQVLAGMGTWLTHTIEVYAGSTTRISPRVTLTGALGPQVGIDVMPELTSASAPAGGNLGATVITEDGDLVILAVGLPGPSVTVPGLQDPFWLDPGAHVFVAIGIQQAGTPISGSIPVPGGNTFRGLHLNWGAACQGSLTGFQATNPVTTLVY